ncbi:Trm112 family protein [Catenovulum sp. SX2]|uniref:Trm112 family protein n=1 Tax=Catenovulum TaxID=1172191 RepID=UPI0003131F93|nr:Trm112 family protein [Catenovulum agarivorans]
MAFDTKLLDILACPICKSGLHYKKDLTELWCKADRLAYPIRNDIPVLMEPEARALTLDEVQS